MTLSCNKFYALKKQACTSDPFVATFVDGMLLVHHFENNCSQETAVPADVA